MNINRLLAAAVLASGAAGQAQTQTLPAPQNVVSLSASATLAVTKDVLTIVFSTGREGSDAGAVQSQLKQAVDAALTEIRKGAKLGQIDVQTCNFSLYPRYSPAPTKGSPSRLPGGITGWQGSAEVIVEGKDITAIAQLAGRVQTLNIARVGFSLSRVFAPRPTT